MAHISREDKAMSEGATLLAGSKIIGCLAHIEIKDYTLYPEYALQSDSKSQTEGAILKLKEENLNKL